MSQWIKDAVGKVKAKALSPKPPRQTWAWILPEPERCFILKGTETTSELADLMLQVRKGDELFIDYKETATTARYVQFICVQQSLPRVNGQPNPTTHGVPLT